MRSAFLQLPGKSCTSILVRRSALESFQHVDQLFEVWPSFTGSHTRTFPGNWAQLQSKSGVYSMLPYATSFGRIWNGGYLGIPINWQFNGETWLIIIEINGFEFPPKCSVKPFDRRAILDWIARKARKSCKRCGPRWMQQASRRAAYRWNGGAGGEVDSDLRSVDTFGSWTLYKITARLIILNPMPNPNRAAIAVCYQGIYRSPEWHRPRVPAQVPTLVDWLGGSSSESETCQLIKLDGAWWCPPKLCEIDWDCEQ